MFTYHLCKERQFANRTQNIKLFGDIEMNFLKKKLYHIVSSILFSLSLIVTSSSMETQQEDISNKEIWAVETDYGFKPLGEYTPFMKIISQKTDRICNVWFYICPTKSEIANRFADESHKNMSPIGIMSQSQLCMGVKAINISEAAIVAQIIKKINEKKENEEVNCKSEMLRKYLRHKPPFTFLNNDHQPECTLVSFDLDKHQYLKEFFDDFQMAYPDLKSDILQNAYKIIQEKMQLSNS